MLSALERYRVGVEVQAGHAVRQLIGGGDVIRKSVAREVPDPLTRLQRQELVATGELPFQLGGVIAVLKQLSRLPWHELRGAAFPVPVIVLIKGNELACRGYLIRHLGRRIRLEHRADHRRPVGHETPEYLDVLFTSAPRLIEPELVPDDPSTQIGADVQPFVDRISAGDAARPQFVVEVVALKPPAGLRPETAAVEVVTPGLEYRAELHAARRTVCTVADGRHRRLFHGRIVEKIAAAVRIGIRRRRRNPLDHRP